MSFKFQVLSDIHLELYKDKWNSIPKFPITATNLILAGDIGNPFKSNYKMFIEWCSGNFNKVWIISGNHEYYSKNKRRLMEKIDEQLYQIAGSFRNVTYLQCDTDILEIDGFKMAILGCTFWSYIPDNLASIISKGMNDYYNIHFDSYLKSITTTDINKIHKEHIDWVVSNLETNQNDESIDCIMVITHHTIHPEQLNPIYKDDPFNHAYCTDIKHIVTNYPKLRLWINGHTHYSKESMFGLCKFVSNCVGYPDKIDTSKKNYIYGYVVEISTVDIGPL